MDVIVLKFGGSCLANPEKIRLRAQQIKSFYDQGLKVITVVSAMGNQTNELVNLAYKVSPTPHRRELDMLLTTGERISMALLSMALNDLHCPAISFTGSQAGVLTEEHHNHANIKEIKPIRVEQELSNDKVVIIAGFQGVNPITKEVTTLGRGGSDTTAMAFAKHFKGRCYIFKDVPGVCSADPNKYHHAQTFKQISHDQLLQLCAAGSQILNLRAAELAREIHLNYRISFADDPSIYTEVTDQPNLNFRALSNVKNASAIDCMEHFNNWLEKEKLALPQFISHAEKIYFWGDVETIKPIHQRLTTLNIPFQHGLSLISLIKEGEKIQRIFCSDEECELEKEKYENFLKN